MLTLDHTEEVGEHAPADSPRVPDYVIDALNLADIGRLCSEMAELPRDRWTSLIVSPTTSIPPLPSPS